jgi:hypothetical protein
MLQGKALCNAKPALMVDSYFQVLALFKTFQRKVHPTLIIQELQIIKCTKQHNINYQKCSLSFLSYLHDDCHKQAIFISERHGDLNRCTPCRGNPDQHDMYTSHASPRTSLLLRKRAPDTIHSTPADRSVGPYPVSLPSQPWSNGGKAKHLSMVGY